MPEEPSYLSLLASGELDRRVQALEERLGACDLCPRACGVDRRAGALGFCRAPLPARVARHLAHHGEEPVLSGTGGSGTIFFTSCHLACAFCQNHQISQQGLGEAVPVDDLATRMLDLQAAGCHNINWVSPTHYLPQAVAALAAAARRGLRVPLVYNSNGWESVETLRLLADIVDIYLPDAKYADDAVALRLSGAPRYTGVNLAALQEMFWQVGPLELDPDGVARRGLIVRHLVLPGGLAGTTRVLERLRHHLGRSVAVSLMSQYAPVWRAASILEIARPVTPEEYAEAVDALERLEFDHGWVQHGSSVEAFLPDFTREEAFRDDLPLASPHDPR